MGITKTPELERVVQVRIFMDMEVGDHLEGAGIKRRHPWDKASANVERVAHKRNAPKHVLTKHEPPIDAASILREIKARGLKLCRAELSFQPPRYDLLILEFRFLGDLVLTQRASSMLEDYLAEPFRDVMIYENPEGRVRECIILRSRTSHHTEGRTEFKYDLIDETWVIKDQSMENRTS